MVEAAKIVVLPSTEAVRKRPSMYVGDLNDGTGLQRLIWEVLLNVLDQHLQGQAHRVRIELFGDGTIEIQDDGPGISLEPKRYDTRPRLDAMLVDLCSGPTSGLVPTSALSAFFEIETTCRGERARVRTERGLLTEPAHSLGPSAHRGTLVRFRPDETIFGFAPTPAFLAPSIEAFAWMYPALAITWQGKVIAAQGGLAAWTRTRAQRGLEDDFVFARRAPVGEHFVDLAFGWERADSRPRGDNDNAGLLSFVNFQRTQDGTHIPGVAEGLAAVALAYGQRASSDAFASRLVGAVHVVESDPRFSKPVRNLRVTPLAKQLVSEVVQAQLPAALECHPLAKARFLARARGM
jgi:DNA gyrase subunit B